MSEGGQSGAKGYIGEYLSPFAVGLVSAYWLESPMVSKNADKFQTALIKTALLGAYVAAAHSGICDIPPLDLARCCDCSGCDTQKRHKAEPAEEAVYIWLPDAEKDSWVLCRETEPQSVSAPVLRLSRWTSAENTWLCTFCGDDSKISVAPEDGARLFRANSLKDAKRYVETNVYPRIRVKGDSEAPVAPDATHKTGFWWTSKSAGGDFFGYLFLCEGEQDGLCKHDYVCSLIPGDGANIYVPEWIGVFKGDASYPFYAPSLDAARKTIEGKVGEKIEANYKKWARLKEAWKPLGE